MGFRTLSDIREDVKTALGQQVVEDPQVDAWVNSGYLDLTGSIDFMILDEEDNTQSLSTGDSELDVPDGSILIKVVRDQTNDKILTWRPTLEFYRQPTGTDGRLEIWTQFKDKIRVNPPADDDVDLLLIYKKDPLILVDEEQKSVLPYTWDHAIFLFSVHHALLALGQEQRAYVWLTRAISYAQTRLTEQDLRDGTIGLANALSNLNSRLQTPQVGAS